MEMPRYPKIHVCVRSHNRFVVVAAVRQEMRRAGVNRQQIERFSGQALACPSREALLEICGRWVAVEERGQINLTPLACLIF